MSLLKTFIEDAAAGAVGAGAISTGGGHETVADYKPKRKKKRMKEGTLFSGGVVNGEKRNVLKRVMNMETVNAKKGFLESLGVDHGKNDFDASDVLSKIDSAQNQEKLNDDTVAFGLEDDEGNLVKVYVKTDQAEEFENTLSSMLAGALANDADPDAENANAKEIAEVLYELKDKFDIVDVEWPGIETDEEEEQEVVDPTQAGGVAPGGELGAEGGNGDSGGGEAADDLGLDGGGEEGLGLDGEEGGDMEADDGAKSALQDVIDVMKADAEAKMADANAREAEARAKEAEYAAQGAASKVKREEQVYDMEAAEKDDKDRKKEGEQQAKLARFQHSKAQDSEANLSFESTKTEEDDGSEEITLTELTELIFKNLRHQG